MSTDKQKYTLYGVRISATHADETKFVGFKNNLTKREIEENHFDTINEEEAVSTTGYVPHTGVKYFELEDLQNVGLTPERGFTYNLTYEKSSEEEINDSGYPEKDKLVSFQKVKTSTKVIYGHLSAVRYWKNPNNPNAEAKPYIILQHSIKEKTLESAPNKQDYIDSLAGLGLTIQPPYNQYVAFSAFIFLYGTDVEKYTTLKDRKQNFLVLCEEINEDPIQIRRILSPVFEKGNLKLQAEIISIEDNENGGSVVKLKKETSWSELREENLLNLRHFAIETEDLDTDKMVLTFQINVTRQVSATVGEIVELRLNNKNTSKLKNPKIVVETLEVEEDSPLAQEGVEEIVDEVSNGEILTVEDMKKEEKPKQAIPEISISEDDIPF